MLHVSITIRTGRAGHQRKPTSRLSSLRQLKLTSTYRIGPARAYLVYFTQSWRSLPSMFVFGTIEDTPSIIRTRCKMAYTSKLKVVGVNDMLLLYKKRFLRRYIQHSYSDLINNMDLMRISGTETSSVILSQTKKYIF